MCEGFLNKQTKDYKKMRQLGWWIICSYADPKSMPSSLEEWWPLSGDAPVQRFKKESPKRRKRIEDLAAYHLALLNKEKNG